MPVISNFRRSKRRTKGNQMVVQVEGCDSREKAEKLVGKIVTWKTPGKKDKVLKGKVSSAHGNKGAVRVLFETGMPGQSVGKEVKVE